jgi:uncharacterized protein (TIGR03083 family)
MDYRDYCTALRREGHALTEAARVAGIEAVVPSCPEWDVAELLGHVGRLHRWITAILEAEGDDPTDHWSNAEPPPVETRLAWFDEGVDVIANALLRVDPATEAWSWTDDRTAGFWARRQANETAVHRWDAQSAAGAVAPIEPALAVDGIDEFFGLIPFWRGSAALHGAGETIHLHATDRERDGAGDGEWFLRVAEGAVIVTREHAEADVDARGSASDLLLFLYGRVEPSALTVIGDTAVLDRWHEQVRW